MNAAPGTNVRLVAFDCPTGLVGTISVSIVSVPTGAVLVPYTTVGIVEEQPGNYVATVPLPLATVPGAYLAYWDSGDGIPFPDADPFFVSSVAAAESQTFAELKVAVTNQAFSQGRYTTQVSRFLNEAVSETCKRMRWQRGHEILDYHADGRVTQSPNPFWRVEELYLASDLATGSGEAAIAQYATTKLEPLPTRSPAGLPNGTPMFYSARRSGGMALDIIVMPASSTGGKVAITGLQRPGAMVLDTDTSGLGEDMDRGLIAWAKSRCFEIEDDIEMAQYWKAQWEACLTEGALEPQDDGPIVTPGTWGDGELALGGV